jgi:hypothetical protein
MRLRKSLATPPGFPDGVLEVGVEWRRGFGLWRSCYAVVLRLDARTGALLSDADWLERAEFHSRIEEGRAAIILRSHDPRLAHKVEARVHEWLESRETTVSAAEAMHLIQSGVTARDAAKAPDPPRAPLP